MLHDGKTRSLKWIAAALLALMYFVPQVILLLRATYLTSAGDSEGAGEVRALIYLLFPLTPWLLRFLELFPEAVSMKLTDVAVVCVGTVLYFFLGYLWGALATSIKWRPQDKRQLAMAVPRWVGLLGLSALFFQVLWINLVVAVLALVFVRNCYGF